MILEEFRHIYDGARREHPRRFQINSEEKPQDGDLKTAERDLNAKLPAVYVEFLFEFGGGDFVFANVFSVKPNSRWNIVDQNRKQEGYLPRRFIAVSDDGTGGLFGFLCSDGICENGVRYWDHETRELSDVLYYDLYEYLAKFAFGE